MTVLKKTTLMILFSCFVFSARAFDIKPTQNGKGVWSIPATVNGRVGAKILECDYQVATDRFSNCKLVGKRAFYSQDELDVLESRLNADSRLMPLLLGGTSSGFMVVGNQIAIMLGTTFVSGGVVLGVGAVVAGAGYLIEEWRAAPIKNGVVKDRDVKVSQDRYEYAIGILREKLLELE